MSRRVNRRTAAARPLRLGVSACLLGERVRWDGGDKRDGFLVEVLGPFVEWVPVCPEVELGLGIPRDPIAIAGGRLVVERTGEDLTARMRRYAERRVRELAGLDLDGYVLKARSPSCDRGRGMFAAVLRRSLPRLVVEDETRLADPRTRARFVARVLAARRRRLR
jgi:uncharacterized protein YbbK (DUF523 family)